MAGQDLAAGRGLLAGSSLAVHNKPAAGTIAVIRCDGSRENDR